MSYFLFLLWNFVWLSLWTWMIHTDTMAKYWTSLTWVGELGVSSHRDAKDAMQGRKIEQDRVSGHIIKKSRVEIKSNHLRLSVLPYMLLQESHCKGTCKTSPMRVARKLAASLFESQYWHLSMKSCERIIHYSIEVLNKNNFQQNRCTALRYTTVKSWGQYIYIIYNIYSARMHWIELTWQ